MARLADQDSGASRKKMRQLAKELNDMQPGGKLALPCLADAAIFLRQDEARTDKMRAVITGPQVREAGSPLRSIPRGAGQELPSCWMVVQVCDGDVVHPSRNTPPPLAHAVCRCAQGTPYEGGLFVFDIFCPAGYPSDPPVMMVYNTGGGKARYNPNLYADGKVRHKGCGSGGGMAGWLPDAPAPVAAGRACIRSA